MFCLPSACFAHWSSFAHLHSIQTEGERASPMVLRLTVLRIVDPPAHLPGTWQAHSWVGGHLVQGKKELGLHTVTEFLLFALGKTSAFSSKTGRHLLRSRECTFHGPHLLSICQTPPLRGWDEEHIWAFLSDVCPEHSALDSIACTPQRIRSPEGTCAFC